MTDIVERLRSSEPLPACPYDKLSPHYLTAPADKPCAVCGGLNEPDAPDLCRGADTRIMGEAADTIDRLRAVLESLTKDPPPTLDEPDTDAEVIIKMRQIAREALDR
jgi:hypothetical protein